MAILEAAVAEVEYFQEQAEMVAPAMRLVKVVALVVEEVVGIQVLAVLEVQIAKQVLVEVRVLILLEVVAGELQVEILNHLVQLEEKQSTLMQKQLHML